MLASCNQKEEIGEAKAVGANESYVVFAATGAPSQTLSVYADGSWAVDVNQPWIQVSPMTGQGMGSITVSVADNATGGVIDSPREGTIILQGRFRERRMVITVHQNGDNYYGVEEQTLAQVAALDDDAYAKVPDAQVVALSQNGFIAADESASLYVQGTGPALGDKLSFNGKKISVNGAPAFEMDEFQVNGNSAVVYPEAKDITASLDGYDPNVTEYVSLSASLVGTTIWVNSDVQIPILDPLESLELGAMDLHKVVFKGYGVGTSMLVVSAEDGGMDEALIPYPLRFKVRVDGINYSTATWSETSRIQPVQGLGYIEYVPFDLENTDGNNKYKLDVSDKSPRVTGPWPGDYWLFYGNGAIKAGSEVRIAFEARTSATGHKFWLLEFLDGDQWRPACETLTTNETGEEITYSHAMNADGATNVKANYVVKYRKNSEHAQFRFRCLANWQASGAGPLEKRNGGSARLTVTDVTDETYQPIIEIVKEGNGIEKDPVYADIRVDPELLTFNGTPGAPKELKVVSDYDWSISTAYDWLHLDVEGGVAGEETTVTVTCDESELAELREGTIRIVSEDSEKVVHVVQSAAGQMLDPFISVTTGNLLEVDAEEGTSDIRVQYNTEYEYTVDADWLTLTPAGSRALVEWDEYVLTRTANESEAPRTGTIRFFNESKKLEAVVTVVQEGKEVIFDNNLIQWGFDASLMGDYKDSFEKDNNFKANIAGVGSLSWTSLPENIALDTGGKKSQVIGGTGQPYITGAWPGDYWEFTVPLKNVPAGNVVTFTALHRISGTGQKYWRMDWSLDGTTWTPVKPLETETETGTNAQYTHIAPTSDIEISESFKLPEAVADGTLRIRFTCVANWQGNGKGALTAPNGGTHRWSGAIENGPKITITEPQVTQYFADDFEWLQKYIDGWVAANPDDAEKLDPVGSQLSSHAQPNIWNVADLASTLGAELETRGYEDLNPSAKTLYLQKNYFKMGASKKQTGLKLPAMAFEGDTPVDVVVSFDWCAHMGGSGAVDDVSVTVELEGPGSCESSGTAVSAPVTHVQETGQMFWQHASVTLNGVTSATRIKIRPTNMGSTPNYQRWHLDNIRIVGK